MIELDKEDVNCSKYIYCQFVLISNERRMADIIEGRNPVIEALKTGRPINKVLLARNIGLHSAVAEILHLSKSRRIPVEYVEPYRLKYVFQGSTHLS